MRRLGGRGHPTGADRCANPLVRTADRGVGPPTPALPPASAIDTFDSRVVSSGRNRVSARYEGLLPDEGCARGPAVLRSRLDLRAQARRHPLRRGPPPRARSARVPLRRGARPQLSGGRPTDRLHRVDAGRQDAPLALPGAACGQAGQRGRAGAAVMTATIEAGMRKVEISRPDKPLFPRGRTKADPANYYQAGAEARRPRPPG